MTIDQSNELSVSQAVEDSIEEICPVDLGWVGPHWDKNDPVLIKQRLIYKVWLKERRLEKLGEKHEDVSSKLFTIYSFPDILNIVKDILPIEEIQKIVEPMFSAEQLRAIIKKT